MPNFQCKEVCQSPEDGKEEARSKGFLNNRKDQCLPGVGRGREPLARSREDLEGGEWDKLYSAWASGPWGELSVPIHQAVPVGALYFTIHQLLKANIPIQTSKGSVR